VHICNDRDAGLPGGGNSPTPGRPVVRERFWLSFQSGEVRVCASCHGINSKDQTGDGVPMNPPDALRQLLQRWKEQ
jgi:hypothetical protein